MEPIVPGSLQAVLDATAWSSQHVNKHLDGAARHAFSQVNWACNYSVLALADSSTVSLLAHGGLSSRRWQARLKDAEGGLVIRGEQRLPATLVLRVPTPSQAALKVTLGLSELASGSVTELRVCQQASTEQHEGAHTAWLHALPAAFPNLTTLTISRLCGCLPPAALLPHLRELSVHLCPAPATAGAAPAPGPYAGSTLDDQCASIAPYTAQVSTLHVGRQWAYRRCDLPWDKLFAARTDTLQRFTTDQCLSNELVWALQECAPKLQHVTAEPGWVNTEQADGPESNWSVTELCLLSRHETTQVDLLPKSPAEGLLLLPGRSGMVELHFSDIDFNGLPVGTQRRMEQWRFAAPCRVRLAYPTGLANVNLAATGIYNALRQLECLPMQSTVSVPTTFVDTSITLKVVLAAVRAIGDRRPNLTVRLPSVVGSDTLLAQLCTEDMRGKHVAIRRLQLTGTHAEVPWPWASLQVNETSLQQLTYLPDPTNGQHEIEIAGLQACTHECALEQLTSLEQRMQHWTFVVGAYMTIVVAAPAAVPAAKQPAVLTTFAPEPCTQGCQSDVSAAEQPTVLSSTLRVLRVFRWRRDVGGGPCTLILRGWCLSPALVRELQGLPDFGFPVRLTFRDCSWQPDSTASIQLPCLVPLCYSTWCIDMTDSDTAVAPEHISAMCMGAAARGGGVQKLSLVVNYIRGQLSDAQRSAVEACVDERGLGKWVGEIKWAVCP